jgi:VanZ family protein
MKFDFRKQVAILSGFNSEHMNDTLIRYKADPAATQPLSQSTGNGCRKDSRPLAGGQDHSAEIHPDGAHYQQTKGWAIAALLWIGVIMFSSTELAGQNAKQAYSWALAALAGLVHANTAPFNSVRILVEKGFHVFLFVVFAVLLCKAISIRHRNPIFVFFIGSIVGSCSEWFQRFQPGRDPSLRDVCINVAATAFGVVLSTSLFKQGH